MGGSDGSLRVSQAVGSQQSTWTSQTTAGVAGASETDSGTAATGAAGTTTRFASNMLAATAGQTGSTGLYALATASKYLEEDPTFADRMGALMGALTTRFGLEEAAITAADDNPQYLAAAMHQTDVAASVGQTVAREIGTDAAANLGQLRADTASSAQATETDATADTASASTAAPGIRDILRTTGEAPDRTEALAGQAVPETAAAAPETETAAIVHVVA